TPRCYRAEVVDVRRNQTAIGADLFSIQPDSRFPVRTLQRQHVPAVHLVLIDLDIALIPRYAEIVTQRLCEERHFYFARFSESFVVFAQVPEMIVEREHPRRRGADWGKKRILRLKNSRQPDRIAQSLCIQELLLARISRVQLKTPLTVEWNWSGRAH